MLHGRFAAPKDRSFDIVWAPCDQAGVNTASNDDTLNSSSDMARNCRSSLRLGVGSRSHRLTCTTSTLNPAIRNAANISEYRRRFV